MQLEHHEIIKLKKTQEIFVIADNIRTPENVGMILRVSEGFGVKKICFIGDSPNLSNRKVLKTARSSEKMIEIQFSDNIDELLLYLRKNNYTLIGLEITSESIVIKELDYNLHPKIALFIGNERNGISQNILDKMDFSVHFDLFGKNSSINVVNALSIGLYEINRN